MKTYKHKKLGYIAHWYSNELYAYGKGIVGLYIQKDLVENSDDWLDITDLVAKPSTSPKRDWEITAFVMRINHMEFATLRENGKYGWNESAEGDISIETLLKMSKDWAICSVKRLSDNEEFKIGDKFKYKFTHSYLKTYTITSFTVASEDVIKVNGKFSETEKCSVYIGSVQKVLLTTEDGVDLVKDDKVYSIHKDDPYEINEGTLGSTSNGRNKQCTYFSSLEKASEYIEKNKIVLVTEDGVSLKKGDKCVKACQLDDAWHMQPHAVGERVTQPNPKFFSSQEKASEYWRNNQVLFTTEDGIAIKRLDKYYSIHADRAQEGVAKGHQSYNDGIKRFSTREAAEKYLESQKILFTTADGVAIKHGDKYYAVYKYLLAYTVVRGDKSVKLNEEEIKLRFHSEDKAKEFVEKHKVIFTTADGVGLKKDEEVWWCTKNSPHPYRGTVSYSTGDPNYLFFSTKEKAEEYILWNKPCLSLREIEEHTNGFMNGVNKDRLVKLAKSKK